MKALNHTAQCGSNFNQGSVETKPVRLHDRIQFASSVLGPSDDTLACSERNQLLGFSLHDMVLR